MEILRASQQEKAWLDHLSAEAEGWLWGQEDCRTTRRTEATRIGRLLLHNPLWFLVLSLFLPRVALFIGWLDGWSFGVPMPLAGLLLWAFLPRVLVLISIYALQGVGFWFLLHLVVAIATWTGSAGYANNRRTRRREY